MKSDIPLVSIGFDGYSLEEAAKGLAKTRSKSTILCAIDGFTKHVVPEETSEREWERAKMTLAENGLRFFGLFGHCNLSDDRDIPKLMKRMAFTRSLGGGYIDTNAGPKGSEEGFFKNLPRIVELAEELDLLVCLETHGDMLETGERAERIFKKVKSERVRISYDPANVFFYTRGKTDPVSDISHAMEYVGMIHFKGVNVSADGRRWGFPPAGKAAIRYDELFGLLRRRAWKGLVAVELEERFRFEEGKGWQIDPVWPEERIVRAYDEEIAYLNENLDWL